MSISKERRTYLTTGVATHPLALLDVIWDTVTFDVTLKSCLVINYDLHRTLQPEIRLYRRNLSHQAQLLLQYPHARLLFCSARRVIAVTCATGEYPHCANAQDARRSGTAILRVRMRKLKYDLN